MPKGTRAICRWHIAFMIFEFLSENKKADTQMGICFLVRRKGLEPPTYWFVASHSIQLSYRRIHCSSAKV